MGIDKGFSIDELKGHLRTQLRLSSERIEEEARKIPMNYTYINALSSRAMNCERKIKELDEFIEVCPICGTAKLICRNFACMNIE